MGPQSTGHAGGRKIRGSRSGERCRVRVERGAVGNRNDGPFRPVRPCRIYAHISVLRNLAQGRKCGAVLHELGHAMGINGHTDRYLSSSFYVDLKGGSFSDGFSIDDRKLLDFCIDGFDQVSRRAQSAPHLISTGGRERDRRKPLPQTGARARRRHRRAPHR